MDYFIRIVQDPYSLHPSRGFSKHNMWSLVNRVFKVVSPEPVMEEVVSLVDGKSAKVKSYIIERDEFLKVAPEFEQYQSTNTYAIPCEFAVPWIPEGRINPETGKGCGLEEGVRKSNRWVEEAKKLGLSDNPFLLRR